MSHVLKALEDTDVIESARGIYGVMQQRRAQGITTLPFTTPGPQPSSGLQSLQAKAGHKTLPKRTPSNKKKKKKSTSIRATKGIARKALSPHGPVGAGVVIGLDALVPGLGIVTRAIQQTFGR
jgi:hypothetical protein